LRLKDAIHPDEANTPMGRICYQLQLVLSGSRSANSETHEIKEQLAELSGIFIDPICRKQLLLATEAVVQGKFYTALKSLKPLLPIEQNLLARPLS
jgi:flagellar protein FlbT